MPTTKRNWVVLYGRRRVGKTELLAQFARNKQHVFFASPSATRDEQLAAFSRQMFEAGAPAGRYLQQYSDWESALADIVNLPTQDGKRRLIIIDEFPYLAKSDSSLPSVLQNLWDHTLKDSNVMMVLCGTSMSFIEKRCFRKKIAIIRACHWRAEAPADAVLGCRAILPRLQCARQCARVCHTRRNSALSGAIRS